MFGPLQIPANPEYQLVGVYNLEMAWIYNYLYSKQASLHYHSYIV